MNQEKINFPKVGVGWFSCPDGPVMATTSALRIANLLLKYLEFTKRFRNVFRLNNFLGHAAIYCNLAFLFLSLLFR